jgi:hypothetical protein
MIQLQEALSPMIRETLQNRAAGEPLQKCAKSKLRAAGQRLYQV